jgi:hypothetical protein
MDHLEQVVLQVHQDQVVLLAPQVEVLNGEVNGLLFLGMMREMWSIIMVVHTYVKRQQIQVPPHLISHRMIGI